MTKKLSILILLIICFCTPVISGCWSRREVEELAIVSSIGVDSDQFKGSPKYKVTCNIYRPSLAAGGGGGSSTPSPQPLPVWQISALGDTVDDAITNISTRSPRELFLGDVRLVVFGKDAAQKGVQEMLDYFMRNRDIRLRVWLVTVDGKAQDLMRAMPDLEPTIAAQGAGVSKFTSKEASKYYAENLNDFVNSLAGEGEDPLMGRAELIKPVPPQVGSDQTVTTAAFRGAAVYSNEKLVGWLEDNEVKGLLYIIGKSRRGVVPVSMGKGRPTVSVVMQKAESQIKPDLVDDKLHVTVKIKAEGSMEEEGQNQELATPEGIKELEGVFSKQVEELCKKSVVKAQQYKADIFGFGSALYRRHPDQWKEIKKEYPQVFAKAEINIEVKAKITNTGLLAESIKPKP